MAAPKKAVGAKSDKILREALMIAVNREDMQDGKKVKRLHQIADRVSIMAAAGDMQAIKEVWDRIEGKPSQSIGLGQAPELEPIEAAVRPTLTRDEWLAIHKLK
jgi:predicted oxidoreductase